MYCISDCTRECPGGPSEAAPGGGKSVLIVDDEPLIRLMLASFLSSHGWKGFTAESPPAALQILQQEPISHSIVDIHLGEYSGFDLIRHLNREWPGIRVVAITGSVMDGPRAALEAGASAVLSKPLTSLQLVLDALEGRISGGEFCDESLP